MRDPPALPSLIGVAFRGDPFFVFWMLASRQRAPAHCMRLLRDAYHVTENAQLSPSPAMIAEQMDLADLKQGDLDTSKQPCSV